MCGTFLNSQLGDMQNGLEILLLAAEFFIIVSFMRLHVTYRFEFHPLEQFLKIAVLYS